MNRRKLLLAVVVVVSLVFLAYYVYDYYRLPDAPPSNRITELVLPDVHGAPLALTSLNGRVVLVRFWASWCSPCRQENPEWVELYDRYHQRGFTIYSISLDLNRKQWLAAIEKDNLHWPAHVSELQGWKSSVAQQYGIRSIPANFLLDEQGNILRTNLTPQQAAVVLEKLLGGP